MHQLHEVPTLSDIQSAHTAIKEYVHRTPILTSSAINDMVGASLFFKCENFQKIGAFKMRGAVCAGLALRKSELAKGLATHSSGNHAQAVALTAKLLETKAHIVMPSNSPKIKIEGTKGYGAEVTFSGTTIESRQETLDKVIEKTGATFIHPFDNYNVICGQATCSMEVHDEISDLDSIISPIGGGGLMSGTALTTHFLKPDCKVYGAEPSIVDDAFRSVESGTIQKNENINTIADGLRTNLSEKTFGIIQKHVDEIFLVEEAEIVNAMRIIWERMKIIIEPSCAVPLAAILKNKSKFQNQKIGLILTGGNVDLGKLPF